jgi:hypothetical protein
MKYSIDTNVCQHSELSFTEVLMLMIIKTGEDCNKVFESLIKKEAIVKKDGKTYLTFHYNDVLSDILLTSDKDVPRDSHILYLAEKMIELFPRGKKPGTNTYWRSNKKDISLRLKKFFKLYGNKYTQEQILDATKAYIDSFNGNYQYMKVLKYFIWKVAKRVDSEGNGFIEEVSDLATYMDNKGQESINTNWMNELK